MCGAGGKFRVKYWIDVWASSRLLYGGGCCHSVMYSKGERCNISFLTTMKCGVEEIKFMWEDAFDHESKEDASGKDVPYEGEGPVCNIDK